MGVIEFPDWRFAHCDVPSLNSAAVPTATQPSATDRIRNIWPVFVVGLGLLASAAWTAFLSWLLYHTVLMVLILD